MAGRKSKVLFDSIDLEIFNTIEKHNQIGVLELAEKINLTHQNLKTHLEKLLRANIITTLTSHQQEGKKIEFTTITSDFFDDLYDGERADLLELERKQLGDFLLYIRTINSLDNEKETLTEIINTLKKKESQKTTISSKPKRK